MNQVSHLFFLRYLEHEQPDEKANLAMALDFLLDEAEQLTALLGWLSLKGISFKCLQEGYSPKQLVERKQLQTPASVFDAQR